MPWQLLKRSSNESPVHGELDLASLTFTVSSLPTPSTSSALRLGECLRECVATEEGEGHPSDRIGECLRVVLAHLERPDDETDRITMMSQLLAVDVPTGLVRSLGRLGFEARKDAMFVFSAMLREGMLLGADSQIVDYVQQHPRVCQLLLEGSGHVEAAAYCAQMIRSCTRYPQLVDALHREGAAIRLVTLASHPELDVSMEAFSSLREVLLTQAAVSASYVLANSREFFGAYNAILQSDDYMTQRQALRLLREMLLEPSYKEVSHMYSSNEFFLQIHMNLLLDRSRVIYLDAFRVFQLFAQNPRKPRRVHSILYRNANRLFDLLETFRVKESGDQDVVDELENAMCLLQALEPLTP
jgi:calcium binding protein 39